MCKHLKPEKIYKPHDYLPLPPPNFDIYHYKGDRKYISGINHLLPVDDNEFDRLQHQHNIYYHVWGSHFSAPIKDLLNKNGTNVLDVGCGPAMWTLEMASLYPRSKFTGIDFAPIYPVQTKPLNVEFLQENIIKNGLPYEDNTFDYVFSRFKGLSYTIKDWKFVINEICRVCKVGGYIEFMEKDIELDVKGKFTKKALSRFVKNLRKKKIEPIISQKIIQHINETKNFPNIKHEKRDVPTGEWGDKEEDKYKIGKHNKEILKWGSDNLKNIMVEDCNYDEKEWDLMVTNFMKELDENHVWDNIHRIWAKKETECKAETCKHKFDFSFLRSLLPCLKK